MKFKYFLDNDAGWAGVTFESGSFSKTYMISYCLGHNLTQLLGGMIALFDVCAGMKMYFDFIDNYLDEDGSYKWCIDQEGSIIKFIFSVDNDRKKANLKITERDGDEKCVFDGEIDAKELLGGIAGSCDEMLSTYGIIGYYNNFWHEFPVSYFLLLKNHEKQKLTVDTFKQECPLGKVHDVRRTNLDVELEYLSNK